MLCIFCVACSQVITKVESQTAKSTNTKVSTQKLHVKTISLPLAFNKLLHLSSSKVGLNWSRRKSRVPPHLPLPCPQQPALMHIAETCHTLLGQLEHRSLGSCVEPVLPLLASGHGHHEGLFHSLQEHYASRLEESMVTISLR